MKNSLLNIAMLFLIAYCLSSCISGKVTHCDMLSFKTVEQDLQSNYVIFKDGKQMDGAIFDNSSRFTVAGSKTKTIVFGGKTYGSSDVKAYQNNGEYFEKDLVAKVFARRVVHGKVNVYANRHLLSSVDTRNGISRSTTEASCFYFIQNGDGQPLVLVKKMQQFADAVQGCAAAYNMLAIDGKELWKTTKSTPTYINDAFERYNNGCKKK